MTTQFSYYDERIETAAEQLRADSEAYQSADEIGDLQNQLENIVGFERVANSYLFYPTMEQTDGKSVLTMMLANDALLEAGLTPTVGYELPPEFVAAYEQLQTEGIGRTTVYSDQSGTWVSII
ncbi:hypothetical protein LOK74_03235 [Brevibacillus humidisoli]|uniref:hypothetical protein n=1 Tax=Brevibacillus humidisoli TaxID=2895522 RepID=UPI001E3C01B5|nr:hypothetical protein [Brevibacillus humidisoli]UFJ41560.1 hypothetical protein LOK74_03235 [Brevibacillus humidisoli]